MLYEIQAWTGSRQASVSESSRDLSVRLFNDTETDTAYWDVGIELRTEEEGPLYKLSLYDALTGEVVDTRSLPSRQPISRLLRAYEDRDPAALPHYVPPVRDLELVGEVPGLKEGLQYGQGVIAFDGGEMPAGWLAAPRWSIRRSLLTSL